MSDNERDEDHDDEGDFDEDSQEDIEVLSENENQDEDGVGVGGFKNKRGYKKNTERITAKFLTKYERARILGTRALQLSKNAPPMVVP